MISRGEGEGGGHPRRLVLFRPYLPRGTRVGKRQIAENSDFLLAPLASLLLIRETREGGKLGKGGKEILVRGGTKLCSPTSQLPKLIAEMNQAEFHVSVSPPHSCVRTFRTSAETAVRILLRKLLWHRFSGSPEKKRLCCRFSLLSEDLGVSLSPAQFSISLFSVSPNV